MSELLITEWPGIVQNGTTLNRPRGALVRANNVWIDGSGRLHVRPGLKPSQGTPAYEAGYSPLDFTGAIAVRNVGVIPSGENETIELNSCFFLTLSTDSRDAGHVAQTVVPTFNTSFTSRCTPYMFSPVDGGVYSYPMLFDEVKPQLSRFGGYFVSHYCREHMYGLRDTYTQSSALSELAVNENSWRWYGFGVPYCFIPRSESAGVVPDPAGFLADAKRTAYVACIVLTIDGVEWLGPASVPYVVDNATGGPANVSLRFPIPPMTYFAHLSERNNMQYDDAEAVMRIYRSVTQTDLTAKGHASDYRLVYEASIVAPLANPFVEFTDIVPDAGDYGGLMGEAAYVSENIGEGFAQRNEWPPGSVATETFSGVTFYGNVWEKQVTSLSLLSVGSGGVDSGQKITFKQYRAEDGAAERTFEIYATPGSPASNEFQVFAGASTTENVRRTAVSLAQAINLNIRDAGIIAEPVGDSEGQPLDVGRIFLTAFHPRCTFEIMVGDTTFPPTSYKFSTEGAVQRPNRIYYSKPFQPYAVPSLNYFDVGSPGTRVAALKANSSSLFCFTNAGVYRVYFDGQGPAVDLVDSTVSVDGSDCVANIGENVYALARYQIVAVNSGGVSSISDRIRPYLEAQNRTGAFGGPRAAMVPWVSQKKMLIFLNSVFGQATNGYFCWDEETGSFVVMDFTKQDVRNITSGFEASNGDVFMQFTNKISPAPRQDTIFQTYGMSPPNGSNIFYGVFGDAPTKRDGGIPTFAIQELTTNASLELNEAFTNPASLSHWQELQLHLDNTLMRQFEGTPTVTFNVQFKSNLYEFFTGSAFGTVKNQEVLRITVPQSTQRSSRLGVLIAFSSGFAGTLVLAGVTFIVAPVGSRTRKQGDGV